jgi:LVIVD repeat-containing protein
MQRKEESMSSIQSRVFGSFAGGISSILLVGALAVSAPVMANKTKPTEVPAKVVAHLALQEPPGSEMLLQNKGDKQYLYVQKASKQGFTVVDVSKPGAPSLVSKSGSSSDATAGKLELAGSDVGLAEIPDRNSKGVIRSADNPTETVKILDLTDPAHPKVLQIFTGVTGTLQDPGRGLIYLANNEGLWILSHEKPGFTPAKKKRPCGSEDAIASMPPDCQ